MGRENFVLLCNSLAGIDLFGSRPPQPSCMQGGGSIKTPHSRNVSSFWTPGSSYRLNSARQGQPALSTNGRPLCPQCGSSHVSRTFCKAIGHVVGVGSRVPLRVELFHCDNCDLAEFTGRWAIDPKARGIGRRRPLR
jgi:hypothetical protein